MRARQLRSSSPKPQWGRADSAHMPRRHQRWAGLPRAQSTLCWESHGCPEDSKSTRGTALKNSWELGFRHTGWLRGEEEEQHICLPAWERTPFFWASALPGVSAAAADFEQQKDTSRSSALPVDLPHDTGCALPPCHLPCHSFSPKRPLSTTEAGAVAQHLLVQSQSRLLPTAALP